MTVNEAKTIFSEKYPNRKITGFWIRPEGYVFNTEPIKIEPIETPGQYVITEDGLIYGTNPMRSKLSLSDMKKM